MTTTSDAARPLDRITRITPNRNVYRPSSHSRMAASRSTIMRLPGCINTGRLLVGADRAHKAQRGDE
jgi:hypothetical protein